MNEETPAVNAPSIMELTFALEVIRLANHYQLVQSQSGARQPRRSLIVQAVTDLSADLAMVRDVLEKARVE